MENDMTADLVSVSKKEFDNLMGTRDLLLDLRKLLGYVENGTSPQVTILQDNATKTWILKVTSSSTAVKYYADTFNGVIAEAVKDIRKD